MKKIVLTLLVLIIAAAVAVHFYMRDRGRWTTEPQFTGLARSASGNDLLSTSDPRVVMRFDSSYRHLGGQKFVLYGVADTEQHFFIETTADDKLKSVYWIQFEAYLPDNSYQYDYDDSPDRLQINDYDFYLDTAVIQTSPKKRRRGTDGALARQFLKSKGYAFPQDFAYARLVYLTDESRRKELMVIFIDDIAPLGLTAPELKEDGNVTQRWPEVEKNFLEKIRSTMTLLPLPD